MRITHAVTGTASLHRVLWLRRGTRIAISLPTLSLVQQENLEARFNRQLSGSGGEFCALALTAALVGCILFDAGRWSSFTAHPLRLIAVNLLVCLLAAAFGRLFGVLRARWQLARLIWEVAGLLGEDHPAPFGKQSATRGERYAAPDRRISA